MATDAKQTARATLDIKITRADGSEEYLTDVPAEAAFALREFVPTTRNGKQHPHPEPYGPQETLPTECQIGLLDDVACAHKPYAPYTLDGMPYLLCIEHHPQGPMAPSKPDEATDLDPLEIEVREEAHARQVIVIDEKGR